MIRRSFAVALSLFLCTAGSGAAQFFEFGQNKIQYRRFDWRVLRGAHVDLYHYPAEAELARAALVYAEESYDSLALRFGHEVPARIPLIVYASHVDFEQTNVLPFVPPEGLLGATDFLKRRVTMPFRGNMSEFRHTLRHELVHVFQLSLMGESYRSAPRAARINLPLWWTEGLAELWSGGEDARDEMILRDLTLSGRLPTLAQLEFTTSFLVYPLGGRIHRWLADTYGDWRAARMYVELTRHDSFDKAVEVVYGRTMEQLSDEFQYAMRRSYYPSVNERAPPSLIGDEIARLGIKPAFAAGSMDDDQPGEAFYISPAMGYLTVYRRSLDPRAGRPRSVVAAGRSEALESFHPFDSRIDGSRKGLLLFSARHQDRDALVVWDLARRKVVGRYRFPDLVSVLSPKWAPDGRSVFFSGLAESGVSDLYRVRLPGGELERLTSDRYQDLDPAPSPDGQHIVFTSDRAAGGRDGAVNVFMLELATRQVRQLTSGAWVDETPSWGPDGRIYFTSSRDTVLNIFSMDTLGAGRRETSAWTGAFDAVPLPADAGLLVGAFQNGSYNVYRAPYDSVARTETFAAAQPTEVAAQWTWGGAPDSASDAIAEAPYRRRLTVDFAAGGISVTPGYGGAQGLAVLLSDLLGDHMVFASVGSFQGQDFGSFFDNLNASAVYLNQTRRVNWGIGGFRSAGRVFEGDLTPAYTERAAGVIGIIRYPLSRFSRVEATGVLEHSDRFDFSLPDVEDPSRIGWIASNYVSFVRDNSLWVASGPIDGMRLAITGGVASDFTNGRFDSFLFAGDVRRYFRLGRRSAFATRLFGFYSDGDRPRRVNIGGTVGLRGYPNFGNIVGSKAWMGNGELRFPLLRHLVLGTPIGDIVFPEFQGALFADIGQAWFEERSNRPVIGSYGGSIRLALAPLAVLRLDAGRRFGGNDRIGYGLTPSGRDGGFVTFFFGYNY